MSLPDFFIIGAAKAGTTSLYALLDRHPDIFMPKIKEPEFFARDDLFAKGLPDYEASFAETRPGQIIGEASTIYTLSPFFPNTAQRIAAQLPQARLIYVMREPVSRAFSFYQQLIKNYQNATRDLVVHRCFEDFIDPDLHARAAPRDKVFAPYDAHYPDHPDLCLVGGDYPDQIDAYLAHFPRQNLLFLTFEDFLADPSGTLRKITEFLGVAPLPDAVFAEEGTTRNVAAEHFDRKGRKIRLQQLQQGFGGLWRLRQILPRGLRDRLRGWMTSRGTSSTAHIPPRMTQQSRARLDARYAAQLPRLRELTGLTFDNWTR